MGASSCMAALVVVLLVSSAVVAAFDGYDGLPRPSGVDGEPTANFGRKPAVSCGGKRADCAWYAWENFHCPPEETSNCSKLLWSALSRGADPASLPGFSYYTPANRPEFYDHSFQENFCLIGCFNLAASNGSSSTAPPSESASPPVNAPPPVNGPPPASRSPPPPSPARVVAPPPPAVLFRPPPPSLPQPPPAGVLSPPSGGPQAPGPVPTQTSGGVCSFPSLLVFMAGISLSLGA